MYDSTYMRYQDRKQISDFQGCRGKGKWEVLLNGQRISIQDDEEGLETDDGDDCTTV